MNVPVRRYYPRLIYIGERNLYRNQCSHGAKSSALCQRHVGVKTAENHGTIGLGCPHPVNCVAMEANIVLLRALSVVGPTCLTTDPVSIGSPWRLG